MRFCVVSHCAHSLRGFGKVFKFSDTHYVWTTKLGPPELHKMPARTVLLTTNHAPLPGITHTQGQTVISVPLAPGERPFFAFTAALGLLDSVRSRQKVDWVVVAGWTSSGFCIRDMHLAYMRYLGQHGLLK
jgi:hypothetical protein